MLAEMLEKGIPFFSGKVVHPGIISRAGKARQTTENKMQANHRVTENTEKYDQRENESLCICLLCVLCDSVVSLSFFPFWCYSTIRIVADPAGRVMAILPLIVVASFSTSVYLPS